jgi:geranylgeranyl diphosphate synthase type I
LELLHAFALLQDDVMDNSPLRRNRPSAHVRFGRWHRERHLSGSSSRFGASLAVLLSDLCLVWADQMMRESGVAPGALMLAWPHYDAMRVELAIGQAADVANDAITMPDLDTVLDVARRKSGNYTVRRPLEIGAAMSGRADLIGPLGGYGSLVGEAFQLRDDILGVFGSPEVTGKPAGGDLVERKATSVVVAAHRMAERPVRAEFDEFMRAAVLSGADVQRWRGLIVATGAVDYIEDLIGRRVAAALEHIEDRRIDGAVRGALAGMAAVCTTRVT